MQKPSGNFHHCCFCGSRRDTSRFLEFVTTSPPRLSQNEVSQHFFASKLNCKGIGTGRHNEIFLLTTVVRLQDNPKPREGHTHTNRGIHRD
jgi:hypothetical protein